SYSNAGTRARSRTCVAAAMAEARNLDLLQHRISRSQPGPARPLELHEELLAAAWARAWPRQLPAPVSVFLLPPGALPCEAPAFVVASVLARCAAGVGDFLGLGDDAAGDSLRSLSLRRLCCSSLTCARRRPVMIAPRTSAVASQMRKRTTATERNRARDAINPERFRGQR